MRILGIDPGLGFCGYGIIDYKNRNSSHIIHGTIQTKAKLSIEKRLVILYEKLNNLIAFYKPKYATLETLFLAGSLKKNMNSMIPFSYARGIILLSLSINNLEIYEYTPREVKKMIIGVGNGTKEQMQSMVKLLLNLKEDVKTSHEADALGLALCLAHNQL